MRRILLFLGFSAVFGLLTTTAASCNRKAGCPAVENAHVKPNRKGELPTKGGKSRLFPKKFYKN